MHPIASVVGTTLMSVAVSSALNRSRKGSVRGGVLSSSWPS
jgi:hypothetical protein